MPPERAERKTERLDGASARDLERAAQLLRAGALVAIPTETVYGLAALALDPLAVRAIYAAKGRPATNPLIVHTHDADSARALAAEWPPLADALAAAFWPGPLTLVLPRREAIPDEVTSGGPTVALRVPSHPLARALLERLGAPLAAPSANRAEHVSPTCALHVLADLDGRIDAVLDGGPCGFGIESTVVQLGEGGPRLLRAGALARDALEKVAGPIALGAGPERFSKSVLVHASPGQHRRHYAPAGLLRLCAAPELPRVLDELRALARATIAEAPTVGVLLCGDETEAPPLAIALRLPGDAAGYARGLYAALRELEDASCSAIAIEEVPVGIAWDAVRDRLQRAAA
jgi:L-threonylcarbamoyladenylate synthase